MKTSLLFLLLTSFCFAAQDNAIVNFANGDKISGKAIALNLETLTLESDFLIGQGQFKLNQILNLQLPAKLDMESTEKASHEAVLELTNGDSIKGQLVGLNDKEIHINTWYAGEMVFRRLNVKSIKITRNSKVLYRGPAPMEGWNVAGNEESWILSNGEFISKKSGTVGREIDYSDEVIISYDLKWNGMMRSKVFLFASDIKTSTPNNGYEIYFQGQMISIRRLSDNMRLGSKMNTRRSEPDEKSKIAIQVSRKSKKILIFIDDELQGVWQDEGLENTTGKGLQFVSESSNEVSVSNIVVSEWDGFIDESLNEDMQLRGDPRFEIMQFNRGLRSQAKPEPAELPEGRMMLSNGDTIEGEVLGIVDEMIKIKTPFAEVIFPIHRINNIALKKADLETPKLYNGDVRAVLADGSKLVFRLQDVKDGKLIGFSQNFGRAEFAQSAFKRIEFNIYPKPKVN